MKRSQVREGLRIGNLALLLMLLLNVSSSFPISIVRAAEPYTGPIFDVHEHASPNTLGTEDQLLARMDANGISRMVLFEQGCCGGSQQDWATGIFRRHKDRFNLFFTLFCYNGLACYTNAHIPVPEDSNLAQRVAAALDSGLYTGIGEMNLRHSPGQGIPWGQTNVPLDNPRLLALYDLLASRDMPVIIHDEPYTPGERTTPNSTIIAELERALNHNNATKFIIAHGAILLGPYPELLMGLMERHKNLYSDLSWAICQPCRGESFVRSKQAQVLERFPERFMIGFDFQGSDTIVGVQRADEVIRNYRMILGQLDPVLARAVAFQNIADIMEHKTPRVTVTIATKLQTIVSPPLSKPVTIDGKWSNPDEWSDAAVIVMPKSPSSSANVTAYLYSKHDDMNFYFLIDFISAISLNPSTDASAVTIDPSFNGGNNPQPDDRRFEALVTGGQMAIGTGQSQWKWGNQLPQGVEAIMSMASSPNLAQQHQLSEFKIPFALFQGLQSKVGFAAVSSYKNGTATQLATYPQNHARDAPYTWGELIVSSPTKAQTILTSAYATSSIPSVASDQTTPYIVLLALMAAVILGVIGLRKHGR